MSFTSHSLAEQSVDLGKAVLALSTLGIFSKLLHVDLASLQILGLTLSKTTATLIPGFLGLVLIYTFVAFSVSRMEAGLHSATDKEAKKTRKDIKKDKDLLWLTAATFPFSILVYSMPTALGAFAIYLLWADSINVIKAILALV